MRIVQALGSSRRGGAERFFIRLTEALHKRGCSQAAIVRGKSWVSNQLTEAGVPWRSALFAGKLDLMTRRVFRRVLQEPPADVVITWMRRATTACPPGPWAHIARLGNYYDLKSYVHCDHLIGITPGIVEHIKKAGWPADKVSFIPNFVPQFRAEPLKRSTLNTPEDAPLIVWLGRIEHEKGPDIVVRALAKVPSAYLWMAGAGAFEPETKALAAEIGVADRVRFLGWRDDIHAVLEAADLYVCASRFEAHGNIILEAWAHGLPIVSARSPGPEHLIQDGKTGRLVANDDPDAMAEVLNVLIANGDLAHSIAEAGRTHFEATYSENSVVSQYFDLFKKLIAERQPSVKRIAQ